MSSISDMQSEAHDLAFSKGWWDPYMRDEVSVRYGANGSRLPGSSRKTIQLTPEELTSKIALVITECSEAIECVRDGQLETFYRYPPHSRDGLPSGLVEAKPEGLPIELADAVIRIMDLCGALGIDLEAAIREKMDFNRTRQHRHGGRAL